MLRGGYQIINLEERNFDVPNVQDTEIKQYVSFESKIKCGKVLLISGLKINGVLYQDFFLQTGNNDQYYGINPDRTFISCFLKNDKTYECKINYDGSVKVTRTV